MKMKKIYILLGLILAVVLISGCIQEFEPSTTTTTPGTTTTAYAVRNLPSSAALGSSFTVTIELEIDESNKPNAVGVREIVPQGWTVISSSISPGGVYFASEHKIEWLFWSGGIPVQDRDLTYTITVPSTASGTATFSGSVYYSGKVNPTIYGDTTLTITGEATTTTTTDTIEEDFEVHEWGVLSGCNTSDSYFLTSRPEQVLFVKQPVIYIHSKDKKPFTAKVRFNNGKPTDTYPEAEVDKGTIIWKDVKFSDDCEERKIKDMYEHIPLEGIIETLNDVDADCLNYNNQRARFLFYEGELKFENKIEATYNFEKQEATLENNGDYPVYNLILVASKEGDQIFNPDVYIDRVEKLNSGEKVTAKFTEQEDISLKTDLISQGFTEKEAEAFSELWKQSFLYPSNTAGWTNLIYRLPKEEYDEMITLDFNPKPKKIIRSLYILIHLNE